MEAQHPTKRAQDSGESARFTIKVVIQTPQEADRIPIENNVKQTPESGIGNSKMPPEEKFALLRKILHTLGLPKDGIDDIVDSISVLRYL